MLSGSSAFTSWERVGKRGHKRKKRLAFTKHNMLYAHRALSLPFASSLKFDVVTEAPREETLRGRVRLLLIREGYFPCSDHRKESSVSQRRCALWGVGVEESPPYPDSEVQGLKKAVEVRVQREAHRTRCQETPWEWACDAVWACLLISSTSPFPG